MLFSSLKIIAGEQEAGFGARIRGTTEQIFNLRILFEKYLQRQQDLYYVFIVFKKAFNRVWRAALWATMKAYNISANLIRVIKNLYDKATCVVLLNSSISRLGPQQQLESRQGCLLLPTIFAYFWKGS